MVGGPGTAPAGCMIVEVAFDISAEQVKKKLTRR
jgi:hypothetical protein